MKRIFSLLLAALMLVSALPVAYATNTYDQGTQVEYIGTATEAYTITVPALLAPGASGTVTLEGTWASDRIVTVTADPSVVLTNSINAADQKTLDVTFATMEYAGDNTQARTYTEPVSVADMPSDALFGTWSGKFNYNVAITDVRAAGLYGTDGSFTPWSTLVDNGTITVTSKGELTSGFDSNTKINTSADALSGELVIDSSVKVLDEYAFKECINLTSIVIPDSVTSIVLSALGNCRNLTTINYTGTIEQWNAMNLESWHANVPATYVQCSDGTVALS